MSKRVYIVSDGGHNYEDAKRFGELIFCTERVIKRSDIAQMYRELGEALLTAQAEDYILVSSLTSMCMVAAAIMADRFGELHLLIYEDGRYTAHDLILSGGPEL